ncbi:peptide deformylase [Patulibacter minatonensis]|uniref:peptide deformylase n=1 Tax=Patulibacter minatonensis TaxID=298163 RepID=UPI00047ABA0E|nr:peptide deformylase [Patulibacter minatonensis]
MADVEIQEDRTAETARAQAQAEADARRAAALQAIRQWGDPVLKGKAREVEHFDDQLKHELDTMGQLMHAARGVGLAANQVGTLHRVLVYAVDGGEGPVRRLVNPRIEWRGAESEVGQEGCLSLAGVLVDVERSVHLRVSAQDDRGDDIMVEASGFEARIIQHEMDHLDGVLILDRTSRDQRKRALRELRARAAAGDA